MDILDAYIAQFGKVLAEGLQKKAALGGILRGAAPFFATALFRQQQRSLVLVASSNTEAKHLFEESSLFLEAGQSLFFPGYENIAYSDGGIGADIVSERVNCLDHILTDTQPRLIFTTADAILRRLPHTRRLYQLAISLHREQSYAPQSLIRDLVQLGYRRVERIEAPGEVCSKGSILDVYPVNFKQALRIDYFDDIIESLYLFDSETQRNTSQALPSKVSVLPSDEVVLSVKESNELVLRLRQDRRPEQKLPSWADADIKQSILAQLHYPGLEYLFPLVVPTSSLWDYFAKPPLVLLYPALEIKEGFSRIRREFKSLYDQKKEDQFCLPPDALLCSPSEINQTNFIEVNPYGDRTYGIQDSSAIRGKISVVRQKIMSLLQESDHRIVLTSPQQAQLRRIAGFFQAEKSIRLKYCQNISDLKIRADRKTLHLLRSRQSEGFSIPDLCFYIITDAELFGRSYRKRTRSKRAGSMPIDSFLDLKVGDHVVHLTHGIGRFIGLEKVSAMGKERDFLLLEYADQARLYVPLDQISMIQQYIAPVEKPRLDSLGKASFKKVKERVRSRVQELAKELLRLQALRTSRKGYAFPPDTAWQEDFEATFSYDETPDQISAIEAVKQDMEAPQPMDRLICGDVGYGKTEVAIRAIFKAVLAGRQAAFIAPTTILALQHYQTLSERFADYPISVDWISRFRSSGEIRKLKAALKAGELDVIVGTHALLSESIRIKNLGLLIIDEEQRFGVSHKEAIKRLRSLVDVITLTATPIPRTLHMSLLGIRELSVIETPPQERLPVQTYVTEDRDLIIREAILREKERKGQVFYLHNHIASINGAAERILELVPEVDLAVLHGRMEEEEIEDILLRFQKRSFDVLVTTSIIENGIDMPNVNTLIVARSDRFGLSQLYQIRGRVGRSARQAYAYLFYPGQGVMTEIAQKRLNTILEYQDLGSGFKVAMRDLEIRGAGNVLGVDQSGHIIDVGYELYLKLLDEAIHELRGEKIEGEQSCSVQLHTDFYIPEEYIDDVRQRIEFYKRFEAARSEKEVEGLSQEMQERFGSLDPVTLVFIKIERIRALAQQAGFSAVHRNSKNRIELRAAENLHVKAQDLLRCIQGNPGLSLRASQSDTLFYQIQDPEHFAEELIALLRQLLGKAQIKEEAMVQQSMQS